MARSHGVDADNIVLQHTVPQEQATNLPIPLLVGGMRTDRTPPSLAENEAAYLRNLAYIGDALSVDKGYGSFSASPYVGTAQATAQVPDAGNSTSELLVTTSTIYKYNTSVNQWQVISYGTQTTVPLGASAGATSFDVSAGQSHPSAIGNLFGVALDNNTQHITTITNIVGSTWTFAAPIPLGRNVPVDALVSGAVPLSGDATNKKQALIVPFPPDGSTIITNGVDPIKRYDQVTGRLDNLGGLPADTTCLAVGVFHECLLLGNLIENGVPFPWRVRMSDQASPQQFTPGTGIAAIYDLLDTIDQIWCLKVLGPWLIAYRDATIMRATYQGLLNATLFWEYMVYDEGAVSQGAITQIGAEHAVVGHAGIYTYSGAYLLDPIGDAVFPGFFSSAGELTASARQATFTGYNINLDELWVFYPGSGLTLPDRMLRCALEVPAWYHRLYADRFTSMSPITTSGGSQQYLLTSSTKTVVEKYDQIAVTDDGATIPWYIITRQYGDGNSFIRWERLALVGVGTGITVQYSINEGVTWTTLNTAVSLTALPSATFVYIDFVSTRIQFKISGSDPTFELRGGWVDGIYDSAW